MTNKFTDFSAFLTTFTLTYAIYSVLVYHTQHIAYINSKINKNRLYVTSYTYQTHEEARYCVQCAFGIILHLVGFAFVVEPLQALFRGKEAVLSNSKRMLSKIRKKIKKS